MSSRRESLFSMQNLTNDTRYDVSDSVELGKPTIQFLRIYHRSTRSTGFFISFSEAFCLHPQILPSRHQRCYFVFEWSSSLVCELGIRRWCHPEGESHLYSWWQCSCRRSPQKGEKILRCTKKDSRFFLIFKVIGAQQGGQNFPKSWNAQKATFFFGVPVDPTHLLGRNLHLECADHKSKKRENSFGFLESLGFVDLNIETGNVSRPLGALMIFFWGIRAKFPEQCPFHQTWFWIFKTYTAHNFKLPTFETSWQESSTQVLRLPNSLTPVTCQLLQCRLFLGFPASLHVGLWKRMVLWCHCANSSAIKLIFEKCSTDWLRGRFSCREFRGSPGNSAILL